MDEQKQARLHHIMQQMQQRWGQTALTSGAALPTNEVLSSGYSRLDEMLGGGFPRGSLVELSGKPTSGTMTLALKTIATSQAAGDAAVHMDLGETFDPEYALRCQVNLDDLLLVRPQTQQDAWDILFDVINSRIPGIVVVNLVTLSDNLSRGFSLVLRRLHPVLSRSRCLLLVLAQPRYAGSPLAASRLQFIWESWLYTGQEICGYRIKVKLLKHKAGTPISEISLDIHLDQIVRGKS